MRATLRELIDTIVVGRNARNKLIECNLPFAAEQARRSMNIVNPSPSSPAGSSSKTKGRSPHKKIKDTFGDITQLRSKHASLEDRVQIANIGLMSAADKFKPGRVRFTTFAAWHIHAALYKQIPDVEFSGLRLPTHIHEFTQSVYKYPEQYSPEDHDQVAYYKELYYGESLDALDLGLALDEEVSSDWDEPVALTTEEIVADYRPDSDIIRLLEVADSRALIEEAFELLRQKDLPTLGNDRSHNDASRQIEVLRRRNGFVDDILYNNDEIGAHFGVTRERVRQISIKALARMRRPERRALLEDYSLGIDDADLRYPSQQHADAAGTFIGFTTDSHAPHDLRDRADSSPSRYSLDRQSEDRESWQAYPNEPWEMTELPGTLDYEQVQGRFTGSLKYLPVHELTAYETLAMPSRAIANILRETNGQLTPGHIEEFWNSRLEAFIEQLDIMTGGKLNPDSVGLLMSGLLAETMSDEDIVHLTIPDALAGKLNFIGTKLSNGTLEIHGDLGDYAGHAMSGIGQLVVHGSVGNYAAQGLTGMAHISIDGNTGEHFANGASESASLYVQGTIESLDITDDFTDEIAIGTVKNYNLHAKTQPSPLSK